MPFPLISKPPHGIVFACLPTHLPTFPAPRLSAGDEEPGVIPADIVFLLDEKPHPRFRREGPDLHVNAVVSLADALCGATVQVGAGQDGGWGTDGAEIRSAPQ